MCVMRAPSLLLLLLVSALLACLPLDVAAAKAKAEEGPHRVGFGVYVLSIHDVEPGDDSYGASLFVWWRYGKSNFDPLRDAVCATRTSPSGNSRTTAFTSARWHRR
jgi:hypothetical protein